MCKYKLSVITINYNNVGGLRNTIESVVNQTNQDFEYIIIDGGSIDGSVDVIKEYTNKIKYWISEKDRGIYHAMNKGIAVANGEYCIFMNSGDTFYHKDVVAQVYKNGLSADVVTGAVSLLIKGINIWWIPPASVSFSFFYSTTLSHQGSFIKTSLLRENLYDEKFKIVSDWKLFLHFLVVLNCSYTAIKVVVAKYDPMLGISSNLSLANLERQEVLDSMFPKRILVDYKQNSSRKVSIKQQIGKLLFRNRYLNMLYQDYIFRCFKKNI